MTKAFRRRGFASGPTQVVEWLHAQALQNQDKHLSVTRVLIDNAETIAGFFTLATGQIDFSDLHHDIVRKLPRRVFPVALLA